ncbi:hypothetical protein CDAR_472871 [Caerostris darwini]|uniref:HNH endonuclease n=1 Tax=Caerostris darwini TaxID=1538125 RepID=A0AAV4VAR4_9ARAC|nr:hypothetical protein CDAR_472871 [Caerostris darwini]
MNNKKETFFFDIIRFRGSAKRCKKETAQHLWNIVCKQHGEASGWKSRTRHASGRLLGDNDDVRILKGQSIILPDYHPRRRKPNKLDHISVQNIARLNGQSVILPDYHPKRRKPNKLGRISVQK